MQCVEQLVSALENHIKSSFKDKLKESSLISSSSGSPILETVLRNITSLVRHKTKGSSGDKHEEIATADALKGIKVNQ